jgi:hypothetical protein
MGGGLTICLGWLELQVWATGTQWYDSLIEKQCYNWSFLECLDLFVCYNSKSKYITNFFFFFGGGGDGTGSHTC